MKKVLKISLIVIYAIVVSLITGYMLTYNEYNVSNINSKTLITSKVEGFKNNSLIIVTKTEPSIGDEVIYYDSYKGFKISKGKISEVYNNEKDTYLLDNSQYLVKEQLIGTTANSKSIPIIGGILKTLSSTIGYLLFVIVPILIVFGYEIHILKQEQRNHNEK